VGCGDQVSESAGQTGDLDDYCDPIFCWRAIWRCWVTHLVKHPTSKLWKGLTGLLKDLSCESAFRSEKWNMLDHTLLHAVAEQLLAAPEGGIVIDGQKFDVKRVGSGRLRSVKFEANGRELHALEQNPDKPSRLGKVSQRRPPRGAISGCGDQSLCGGLSRRRG
jgi:hypothetical protein